MKMVFEKYKRWPQAIIDNRGQLWKRCRVKGWFSRMMWGTKNSNGYAEQSMFINHPDFIGCKKIMWKKDLPLTSTQ